MQRYKLVIQYDGTPYVGFQVQENGNSIQAELNKALKKMTKGNTFLLVALVVPILECMPTVKSFISTIQKRLKPALLFVR